MESLVFKISLKINNIRTYYRSHLFPASDVTIHSFHPYFHTNIQYSYKFEITLLVSYVFMAKILH